MANENGMEILGLDEIEARNTAIDDLETENVNLILVATDESGSMSQYRGDMSTALTDFQGAIANSKEVDEILVSRAGFNDAVHSTGYKPIGQFDTNYDARGMTALYDVVIQEGDALLQYMKHLKSNGMRVKAVFAIFSDGEDTASAASVAQARQKVEELNNAEVITAFISFGNDARKEADNLKFKNILTVGASASELRRAFNVLSKSVIEASKSVVAQQDSFFDM